MRLTCEKVKDFVEISLEGELFVTVHRAFLKSNLTSWDVLSREDFFERFWPVERRVCLQVALNKLSRKSMYSKALECQLDTLLFSEQARHFTLGELERLGMLDDTDFVTHFVEKLKRQGKSERQILFKAHQLGIPSSEVKRHFGGEEETLRRLIEKKYPILLEKGASIIQKQKAMRALFMRGFSSSLITCILNGG